MNALNKINNTSSVFTPSLCKPLVKGKLIRTGRGNSNTNGLEVVLKEEVKPGIWRIWDAVNIRHIEEQIYYANDGIKEYSLCEIVLYSEPVWKDRIPFLNEKIVSLKQELINQQSRITEAEAELEMVSNFNSEEEYLASKLINIMNGSKSIKDVAKLLKEMKSTNLL